MERGILRGLTAFRWAGWTWAATVTVAARHDLRRPWLAWLLLSLALALTAGYTWLFRTRPDVLLTPTPVLAEVTLAVALVVCDGLAYERGHAFSTQQSLGVAWPLFGVLSAGLAFGALAGAAA